MTAAFLAVQYGISSRLLVDERRVLIAPCDKHYFNAILFSAILEYSFYRSDAFSFIADHLTPTTLLCYACQTLSYSRER